ncbi:hypothetical protein, partial [Enterococcus faecalis]|uniref:hypothetical protein n=1 Tax=Enterococcus faecalis TaxID=1351 RepID=UPI003CC6E813
VTTNRDWIENAKISEKKSVLHRFSQNSLFIKVGGRLCPFVLQVDREQGFTEALAEITQESLFFAILYLPTLILDERLAFIADHIHEQPEVCIRYFVPDKRKSGGAIVEVFKIAKNLCRRRNTRVCRWEQPADQRYYLHINQIS